MIETFYKYNLDNRILNNLRHQLNEMIDDERGLVSVEIFRKMFFTFFKGEKFAFLIFDMLLPLIIVFYDEVNDIVVEECEPNDARFKPTVRIELLTKFIDFFNYYPVKMNKIKYKNDSNFMSQVMDPSHNHSSD